MRLLYQGRSDELLSGGAEAHIFFWGGGYGGPPPENLFNGSPLKCGFQASESELLQLNTYLFDTFEARLTQEK